MITFDILKGKALTEVSIDNDCATFVCGNESFTSEHLQSCCEDVHIYKVNGDIDNILNSVIVHASEIQTTTIPEDYDEDSYLDSYTFTIQTLLAENGAMLEIKWIGNSNGYYSETPYFRRVGNSI